MATTGAAGGAAAAAIAQAIKVSGAIIQLEPTEFLKILSKSEEPSSSPHWVGFSQKTIST